MPGRAAHISIGVDELERIAADGWRGLEEAPLGDWVLRAAGGFTGRANSALVVGRAPDGDWMQQISDWYADRGLVPKVQVPLPAGAAVDEALEEAGWHPHDLVRVLIGPVAAMTTDLRQPSRDPAVDGNLVAHLDAEPDDLWLAGYRYRGNVLPDVASAVLHAHADDTHLCFASMRAGSPDLKSDRVLAVARGAVTRGWLGITAVTVDEAHRRRGLARRVMAELAGWGAERGAEAIYLQVAAENVPALGLYEKLGFHRHHDYRYRIGPTRPA